MSSELQDQGPLVSARHVCDRFGVTSMTLWRWLKDEKLRFPRPIIINRRRYFYQSELLEWQIGQLAKTRI